MPTYGVDKALRDTARAAREQRERVAHHGASERGEGAPAASGGGVVCASCGHSFGLAAMVETETGPRCGGCDAALDAQQEVDALWRGAQVQLPLRVLGSSVFAVACSAWIAASTSMAIDAKGRSVMFVTMLVVQLLHPLICVEAAWQAHTLRRQLASEGLPAEVGRRLQAVVVLGVALAPAALLARLLMGLLVM